MIRFNSLLAVGAAVLLTTGGTLLIRANAQSGIAEQAVPMPAQITTFRERDGYLRRARYVGIVRASSDSAVGFEIGGSLIDVAVREGDRVARGDRLAALDTDRREAALRAAEGDLARIRAELELARLQNDRLADLVQRGLASEQAFDEARLGADALAAALAATLARADAARLEITKSTLLAPFDGVVAQRLTQTGAVVNAGTPVLRFLRQGAREVHIGVPVALSRSLQVGQTYEVTIADEAQPATLRAVRADVDPTTLTVGAVFDLPADSDAHAGETATLHIEQAVTGRGGWLPLTALTEGERGLWTIYSARPNAGGFTAHREAVEVVFVDGTDVYVRGTLTDGDAVVATGVHRLTPGTPIEPLASSQPMTEGR